VTAYWLRTLAEHLRRGKTLLVLTVFGVALGVAAVVGIQILNQSALRAFSGSVKAISGEAELTVVPNTPALAESLLVDVLADRDVAAAWPLLHVDVAVAGRDELFLELYGFDLFAPVRLPLTGEIAQQRADGEDAGTADPLARIGEALARPGWVALTPGFAREMGWAIGDTFAVSSGSRRVTLTVGALVDFQRLSPLASRKLAVMDISQAQALFGRPGVIHQIDLRLAPGADPAAAAARLDARLGPAASVRTPEQRREEAAGLLAAFRLNLTALSLISVFVGVFLIYTSVQAALVRRRREFGLLRAIGATPRQLLGAILAEAGLLGAIGTALGVPLGWAVAVRNVETVSATLTNLYLLEAIERLTLPPAVVLLGCGVGVGGALLGALIPALDTSRRDAVSLLSAASLHARIDSAAPRLAFGALLFGAVGMAWFFVWGRHLREGGFVLGFVLLVVLPLCAPLTIRGLCAHIRPHGFGPALSLKNLANRLQTTSSAVAALAVTVSMLVGITLLIGSFRATLLTWLDITLRADVFVSTESWVRGGGQAVIDPALIEVLGGVPGVRGVEQQRSLQVRAGGRRGLPKGGRSIHLSGVTWGDAAPMPWSQRLPLLRGDADEVARRLRAATGALVSEPLARKEGLAVGDTLYVIGPAGEFALPIAGITYDYSTEGGTALVAMPLLERYFGAGPPNNVALYLDPDADVAAQVDRLKQRFANEPLVFRSNRDLRREVLAIFDQTFAVTRILQAMALVIAGCGISLTLLIQARERAAELALWRALGARRRQVFAVFLGEGLGMGALGLALGEVGGFGLAALLILVINRAFFGWTIRPAWPGLDLVEQAAVVLAAAVVASIYPAVRGSRAPVTELSREDLA
jgi:putative ABC transport system permease protein